MSKKKILIGSLSLAIVGISCLTIVSKPTYKTIDNSNLDERMAVYIKNDTGNYEKSNSIPTTGYILNEEKSTCNNNAKPSWNLESNTLKLNDLSNDNTSCYLYFDEYCEGKGEACKKILENKTVSARNKITGPLTENTTGKMYTAEDDDGMSYYFAGAVDNNWVRFAGNYWRIIRVNGDGTIRMIYNGPTTDQTGETTQIGTSAFNEALDDNAYVGYMYGNPGSSTYEETHANINDSTIKKVVDNWYKDNIANNSNYSDKIDINAGFCNDRRISDIPNVWWQDDSAKGYGSNATAYALTYRLFDSLLKWKSIQTPTLKCSQEKDLFTSLDSLKGNKALKNPIGLITIDEVVYSGGFGGAINGDYFLCNGQYYWTMSASRLFATPQSNIFRINQDGYVGNYRTSAIHGVRPVINLKANVVLTGTGTTADPYVVEGA